MKRYAAGMTIALFHGVVLSACAVQQQQRSEPAVGAAPVLTSRDLQLQDPQSAAALLHNMRAVLERGSMTHRLFFTDEQLKATFGGSTVEWIRNLPTTVDGRLGPIDYVPARSREYRLPQLDLTWWGAEPGVREKPAGNFSIRCECLLMNMHIEAVFGDVDRTIYRDRRLDGGHYPAPPRATHPLGNKIARYAVRAPEGYVSSFEVHYDHQGRVQMMAGSTEPAPAAQSAEAQTN